MPSDPRWGGEPDKFDDFLAHPTLAGLRRAQDKGSYILRVGVLFGAGLVTKDEAAALVRGLGVTVLNPGEGEQ